MAPEHTKKVHFFRLAVQSGRAVVRHELLDWPSLLAVHLGKPVADRIMSAPYGTKLVTEPVPNNTSQVILGKVLDRDTGLHRGSLAGGFAVVAPENEDEFFTRVNYAQFVDGSNAFALIGGAGDSPSSSSVEVLANTIAPLGSGRRWIAQPIMSEAEIERFQTTSALKSVTLSAIVPTPDLLDSLNSEAADLYTWSQNVSAQVGSDVRLQVKISLVAPSQHRDAGRRLKDMLEGARERLIPHARKVQVEALDEEDHEIINLMRYKLTASVVLPLTEAPLTGDAFQDYVLQQLNTVCGDMKDRVIAATEE